MRRVLVLGATGFLGRRVVARLAGLGLEVTAHGNAGDLDGHAIVRADLTDAASAAAAFTPWRWDAVVNLAGPVTGGSEDLATGIDVVAAHARIALNVRRFAASARIVHASSMTVYGTPEHVDVDENHPRRPRHLYGLAKVVAEDVLLSAPELDAWVLRLPGLFSGTRRAGALFHFCRAARAGEPLRVTTPVPTPWNVLHVDDAADAIARAVLSQAHTAGALNISYGEPVELVAMARMVADLAGTGASVESLPDVVHPPYNLVADRARTLLAWQPPSLRERIAQLYADYAAP